MNALFIDESKSKGYTIVAACLVPATISDLRKEVTNLRMNGQRRVHFVRESDSRRRLILSSLTDLGVQSFVYHVPSSDEAGSRKACLEAIVADARAHGVTRLVLERDESIEREDRRTLGLSLRSTGQTGKVSYRHESPISEPLLWIPDAIAWSFARGGEWIRRIDSMVLETKKLSV